MKHILILGAILLGTPFTAAKAEQLNLPNLPLVSENPVPPNILFVVDDSGSMDWEIVAQGHYAACNYSNPNNYSNCPTTFYDTSLFYYPYPYTTYKTFIPLETYYLYDLNLAYPSTPIIYFTDILDTDWRIFDSDFNMIYYNPSLDYSPWDGPCSRYITESALRKCENANFSNVRGHPKEGNSSYNSTITLDYHTYNGERHTHVYVVSVDDKGYSGSRPNRTNITTGANGKVDIWDSQALFYFTSGNTITVEIYRTNTSAVRQKISSNNLSGNTCYDILGPRNNVLQVLNGQRSVTAKDGSGCRKVSEVRANYANWFEYHRKRSFTAKSTISKLINLYPNFRFGLSFINDIGIKVNVAKDGDDIEDHNTMLLDEYFKDPQSRYGTPLVKALFNAGLYYAGLLGDKPIQHECQLNNAIMVTDGYWNGATVPLGDVDQDGVGADGSVLSDVARFFYIHDLDPTLADKVPTNERDPNRKQHMNTYGIGFGAKGKLVAGPDGWPTPSKTYSSNWGNPRTCDDCPEKLDDLWHAAYNSHAFYASSNSMTELETILDTALKQIEALNNASLSNVSLPSSLIQTDTVVYQGVFNSGYWDGELFAYPLSTLGVLDVDNPKFAAGKLLKNRTANNRVILTHNSAQGVPFSWTSTLSTLQKNYISAARSKINAAGFNIGQADIINYLRGERTKEISNGGPFRNRQGILGDIVHSSPVYIGKPNAIYTDSSYLTFKNSLANRDPMVAVGANDGMLHIFSANSGEELLAYVPGNLAIWSSIGYLADKDYDHRFFVDGNITVADVYFNSDNKWHTILVGGLRSGGQGIYALDVTNASFSEGNAKNTVLFEFNDAHNTDLGYTFGTPQIVKMNNNQWAIIFGNGYNATKTTYPSNTTDSYVSSTRRAALFILLIERGLDGAWTLNSDYFKINVGNSDHNGLSEPFPVDIDGDFKVDYIYAGDLNGNVYKFDVTSSDASDWRDSDNVKLFFNSPGSTGTQTITTPLVVGPHPDGLASGMMVYFGTGKFIETADTQMGDQSTQAFYGLWDKNTSSQNTIYGYGSLLKQEILASNNNMRATSDNEIDWKKHDGWYMKLEEDGNNQGERVIGAPKLRNGRILFTTMIPKSGSEVVSCNPESGSSWIMELDAKDGSRLGTPPFDVSGDGMFSEADYIYYANPDNPNETVSAPHSGIKSDVGVLGGTPGILTTTEGDKEYKILSGTSGISSKTESVDPRGQGRQSWQEVN